MDTNLTDANDVVNLILIYEVVYFILFHPVYLQKLKASKATTVIK